MELLLRCAGNWLVPRNTTLSAGALSAITTFAIPFSPVLSARVALRMPVSSLEDAAMDEDDMLATYGLPFQMGVSCFDDLYMLHNSGFFCY